MVGYSSVRGRDVRAACVAERECECPCGSSFGGWLVPVYCLVFKARSTAHHDGAVLRYGCDARWIIQNPQRLVVSEDPIILCACVQGVRRAGCSLASLPFAGCHAKVGWVALDSCIACLPYSAQCGRSLWVLLGHTLTLSLLLPTHTGGDSLGSFVREGAS